MNRNLITRMGTATGVVAALVAAVFAVLVTAVRDQRSSTSAARASEQVIEVAQDVERSLAVVDLGVRGELLRAPDVRAARRALPASERRLAGLVRGDALQSRRVAAATSEISTYLAAVADPALGGGPTGARGAPFPGRIGLELERVVATERSAADARRRDADRNARLAIALGVGGLIGSALLIALLTTYLSRHIVVPVRRTVAAARLLARGDLTARVLEQGDAEPVELARAFNTMAASLEESERLKDEFFALVSHELRTPLTSINGYLELVLSDEELSDEARRFLEVADRNGRRLLRLVGDLLFVAQVEAGRLSLERGSVDLAGVAADAVEAARPAAAQAGVELGLEPADLRPLVGDRDRLGQMVDNLISNALKFTPAGGRVDVRAHDAGDRAVVEVADTGMGVPDAEQQQLFERFFRSSKATSQAVPGAGLGLTIVKTIAEAHGGTVALRSREGQGTTVRVELPYERVEAAA